MNKEYDVHVIWFSQRSSGSFKTICLAKSAIAAIRKVKKETKYKYRRLKKLDIMDIYARLTFPERVD